MRARAPAAAPGRDCRSRILLALLCVLCAFAVLVSAGVRAREPQPVGEIAAADLPREARDTLALIERGGPFPYRSDGRRFGNREKLLASRPGGYYREYTVPTPGARDRGARRIVAGRDGEYYYTDDHYRSFRRIRE
ncbi:MAG: ribonuclease [Burkholderiales bacterium]|nr:ribonuclease [Burkholderiales bacterium]